MSLERIEKKLRETKFFLARMREMEKITIGDREPFDFFLSAFLNAAETVNNVVAQDGTGAWLSNWKANRLSAAENKIADFFREDRRRETHNQKRGSRRKTRLEPIPLAEYFRGTEFYSLPFLQGKAVLEPAHYYTALQDERRVTEVCAEYLGMLERMIEKFTLEHPDETGSAHG